MNTYADFLAAKAPLTPAASLDIDPATIAACRDLTKETNHP